MIQSTTDVQASRSRASRRTKTAASVSAQTGSAAAANPGKQSFAQRLFYFFAD
jgi:hypothetical protein